jgi:hypothetical protein
MKKRLLTVLLPIAVLFCTEQLFAQKTTSAPKTKEQILGWLCEKIIANGVGSNLKGNLVFLKDSITVMNCTYEGGNVVLNYEVITDLDNTLDSAGNRVKQHAALILRVKSNYNVTIPFTQLKGINVHKKEKNSFYDYDYISFETKSVAIQSKRNSFKLMWYDNHESYNNKIEAVKKNGLNDPGEEAKYKTFKIHMNFLDNPNLPQKLQNAINDLKKYMITDNELY